MELDDLLDKFEEDSQIHEARLELAILEATRLYAKWMRYHAQFVKMQNEAENELAEMVLGAQLFFTGEASPEEYRAYPELRNIRSRNSQDMARLIDAYPPAMEAKLKLDDFENKVDICRRMLDQLKYRPNHLKTILDKRKFEAGA